MRQYSTYVSLQCPIKVASFLTIYVSAALNLGLPSSVEQTTDRITLLSLRERGYIDIYIACVKSKKEVRRSYGDKRSLMAAVT